MTSAVDMVIAVTGTVFQCITAGFVGWLSYKVTKLGHAIESQAVEAQKAQVEVARTMADIESQQLRASLFDRRLALYEVVERAGALAGSGSGPTEDDLRNYYVAANTFKYWFGDEAGRHAVMMGQVLTQISHLKRGLAGNMKKTPQVMQRLEGLTYSLQLPMRDELDRLVLPQLMIYHHTAAAPVDPTTSTE